MSSNFMSFFEPNSYTPKFTNKKSLTDKIVFFKVPANWVSISNLIKFRLAKSGLVMVVIYLYGIFVFISVSWTNDTAFIINRQSLYKAFQLSAFKLSW